MDVELLALAESAMEIKQEIDRSFIADNTFSQEDYNYIFKDASDDDIYDRILHSSAAGMDGSQNIEKAFCIDECSFVSTGIKMEMESTRSYPDPDTFLNNVQMTESNVLWGSPNASTVPETPPDTPPTQSGSSTPPHLLDCPTYMAGFSTSSHTASEPVAVQVPVTQPQVAAPLLTVPSPTTTMEAAQRTLMLTRAEFDQLTAQGVFTINTATPRDECSINTDAVAPKIVSPRALTTKAAKAPLKITVPAVSALVSATNLSSVSPTALPIIKTQPVAIANPALISGSTNSLLQHINDAKALKRQQRMIKNRESACLSRKKRKEYLQKLEADVQDLTSENARLKEENAELRQRVAQLEAEVKRTVASPSIKKTTAVMAVMFMLTLNLAPFSGLFYSRMQSGGARQVLPAAQSPRWGRRLLWSQSELPGEGSNFVSELQPAVHDSLSASNGGEPSPAGFLGALDAQSNARNGSFKCPSSINQTESLRLQSQLRGWANHVEHMNLQLTEQRKKPSLAQRPLVHRPRLQTWISTRYGSGAGGSGVYAEKWEANRGQNYFQLYQALRRSYEELYEAIQRKDDTFYFVSFSGDYLLLSANSENRTRMPRMSLVMPAGTFNESSHMMKEHVPMVQIDCEVMSTKIMYVKESVIPPHLRQQYPRNTTQAKASGSRLNDASLQANETKPEPGSYPRNVSHHGKVQRQVPRNHTRRNGQ